MPARAAATTASSSSSASSREIPKLPANQVLLRNRRVTGVDWGAWAGRRPDDNQAMLASILEMIERGELDPVEPTTYALADASKALADLAGRKVAGKVALVPVTWQTVRSHGGHSSTGRAPGCDPGGWGFKSPWPPQRSNAMT